MIPRLLSALLAWLLAHVPHVEIHRGRGTIFGPPHMDPWHGGRHACVQGARMALASPEARRLYRAGHHFAHRTMPCWTVARVCSVLSGRCRLATRSDWGPKRALVDLWHVLAAELRHDGGNVYLMEVRP